MSPKADRYIGFILWLLLIVWLWLQNENYTGSLSITYGWGFPEEQSIVWTSIHTLLKGFIQRAYQWTDVFWWISFIIAIFSGWNMRQIPMTVIHRMGKTYDKYV